MIAAPHAPRGSLSMVCAVQTFFIAQKNSTGFRFAPSASETRPPIANGLAWQSTDCDFEDFRIDQSKLAAGSTILSERDAHAVPSLEEVYIAKMRSTCILLALGLLVATAATGNAQGETARTVVFFLHRFLYPPILPPRIVNFYRFPLLVDWSARARVGTTTNRLIAFTPPDETRRVVHTNARFIRRKIKSFEVF